MIHVYTGKPINLRKQDFCLSVDSARLSKVGLLLSHPVELYKFMFSLLNIHVLTIAHSNCLSGHIGSMHCIWCLVFLFCLTSVSMINN